MSVHKFGYMNVSLSFVFQISYPDLMTESTTDIITLTLKNTVLEDVQE